MYDQYPYFHRKILSCGKTSFTTRLLAEVYLKRILMSHQFDINEIQAYKHLFHTKISFLQ